MHDHAQSERDRQDYEWRDALRREKIARQQLLVAIGALQQIQKGGLGTHEIAQDALEAIEKLEK